LDYRKGYKPTNIMNGAISVMKIIFVLVLVVKEKCHGTLEVLYDYVLYKFSLSSTLTLNRTDPEVGSSKSVAGRDG